MVFKENQNGPTEEAALIMNEMQITFKDIQKTTFEKFMAEYSKE